MRFLRLQQLGLLSIALAASLSAGGAQAAPRVHSRADASRFQGWTPLSDYVSAGLAEGGSFQLTVPTRSGNVEVALHPVAVHGPDYHAEEAVVAAPRRGRRLPALHAFSGSVATEGAIVADPPGRGGDFARLALEPGGRISGLMRVDGVLYDLAADAAAGDLVLHVGEVTPEDLADVAGACGAALDEVLASASPALAGVSSTGAPASAAAGALREIELGTEADEFFVSQVGGVAAANARILSIVNSINGIYETDLGLTNKVVFQRAWNGNDPYTSTDSGILLDQFRKSFLADVATSTDEAQLFSGRDFDGSIVGRAWIASACTDFHFGVEQFFRQSDSFMRLIVAHEMGHNLGASHSTDGGIMSPTIDPNVTWFSPTSQKQISEYVATVSCLALAPPGGPPVIAPIGPQSVRENETLRVQLSATDPDGDAVSWSATPLPEGASLSASGLFEWRPPLDTVGCGGFRDVSVQFSATDPDGNRDSETVVISVLDAPSGAPPALDPPADRTVTEGQPLSIPLAANDPDGDTVRFASANLPVGAALSAQGMFRWTPSADELGSHDVTFTATDCTGKSSVERLSISVASSAPHLDALSSASGWKGDRVTLSGRNLAGKKLRVYFGPQKAKARSISDTTVEVKVPKQAKGVGNSVPVSVLRDGVASDNALTFTFMEPS